MKKIMDKITENWINDVMINKMTYDPSVVTNEMLFLVADYVISKYGVIDLVTCEGDRYRITVEKI